MDLTYFIHLSWAICVKIQNTRFWQVNTELSRCLWWVLSLKIGIKILTYVNFLCTELNSKHEIFFLKSCFHSKNSEFSLFVLFTSLKAACVEAQLGTILSWVVRAKMNTRPSWQQKNWSVITLKVIEILILSFSKLKYL